MTKTNLIEIVAEKTEFKKCDAEKAVNAVLAAIEEALAAGEKIQITGFGTFEIRENKEHEGRNPKTGEKIMIAASKVPTFSAGKSLKDAVNA